MIDEVLSNLNDLQKEIKTAYEKYVEEHGEEPLFTDVAIRWLDTEDCVEDVVIKLADSTEEEQDGGGDDDQIFFYCTGLRDLLSLCKKGCEDFVIVDFFGYFYNEL